MTERLVQINPVLASQARKVLDLNKSERHIRGLDNLFELLIGHLMYVSDIFNCFESITKDML